MNLYIIEYLTIDNNIETAEIQAECKGFAIKKFEYNYIYAKIVNVRYKRFI